MNGDPGYFGPDSMMWKINKEITVLFGGARALLMHAAHPLIAAGARQTSFSVSYTHLTLPTICSV